MDDSLGPNVDLDPPGQPPRWGMGGNPHPMDQQIIDGKDQPFEQQVRLFKGFAGHLLAHQTQDVQPRWSGENDKQWLYNLATWFGWTGEGRDAVIREVLQDVMEVRDWELEEPR
jgi:hypothetical protein